MIKDTFFSMPRFVNLCRKDLVENWKTNVLRMVSMYGVMAVIFVWNGAIQYDRNKEYLMKYYADWDPTWDFTLMAFFWCLFGCGCMIASFTFEKMKTKTGRLSVLMDPATSFEKFLSRWLVCTVAFLLMYWVAFELADYTRVLIHSWINKPDIVPLIHPVHLSDILKSNNPDHYLFHNMHQLVAMFSFYLFTQSLFVLGSAVWPKNSFIKTLTAVAAIFLIYIAVGVSLRFVLFKNNMVYLDDPTISDKQLFGFLSIALLAMALFNWTLAYFRFKESEIIQRM